MKEVTVSENRSRLILTAVVGVAMTIYALVMIAYGILNGNALVRFVCILIGLFGLLYFGTGYLPVIPRLLSPRPLLILSEAGLTDAPRSREEVLIPWEEVKRFYLVRKKAQVYIAVEFRDEEAFIDRLSKSRQRVARTAQKQNQPVYTINTSTADISGEEIQQELKKYRKKALKLKGMDLPDEPEENEDTSRYL